MLIHRSATVLTVQVKRSARLSEQVPGNQHLSRLLHNRRDWICTYTTLLEASRRCSHKFGDTMHIGRSKMCSLARSTPCVVLLETVIQFQLNNEETAVDNIQPISPSIHPSIHLPTHPSIHPSIRPPTPPIPNRRTHPTPIRKSSPTTTSEVDSALHTAPPTPSSSVPLDHCLLRKVVPMSRPDSSSKREHGTVMGAGVGSGGKGMR